MPREKGSKNKATLAREAEMRAKIIAEYEANKKAESTPDPPPSAEEVAKTIEEHEELDLGELPASVETSLPTVSAEASKETGEASSVSGDSDPTDDDPLDLDPPPNPIKAKKEAVKSRQEQPKPKSLDRRQPASVPSAKPSKPMGFAPQRKALLPPVSRSASWRLGSKGT